MIQRDNNYGIIDMERFWNSINHEPTTIQRLERKATITSKTTQIHNNIEILFGYLYLEYLIIFMSNSKMV